MAMVDFMEDMESVPMVPTPMPMVSMESKMTIPSTNPSVRPLKPLNELNETQVALKRAPMN